MQAIRRRLRWRGIILLSLLLPSNVYSFWGRPKNTMGKLGLFDGNGYFIPWDDYYHYPNQIQYWPEKLNPKPLPPVNGSLNKMPDADQTPDWRVPEHPFIAIPKHYHREEGRYYRIQPTHISTWMSNRPYEYAEKMLCYCVTVYKRLTPLGMGAVITYRNILTTALTSDMVISRYKNRKTLENILGAWYNTDQYYYGATNTVFYMTPARVIYHPRWSAPEMVNRSHPIPCVYDLALWTSTKRFYHSSVYWHAIYFGAVGYGHITALCDRWSSYYGYIFLPDYGQDLVFIVGCQMIMDIGRRPYPWFKYAMRFHSGAGKLNPCPKTDWEWFLCIECYGPSMRSGAEPGAALHVVTNRYSYKYTGLAGLNSFAMKLRSRNFVNYFTLLDRHPVLEWIYDAVKGRLPPSYLDFRFEAPLDDTIQVRPKGGTWVDLKHEMPWDFNTKDIYAYKTVYGYYRPIWFR